MNDFMRWLYAAYIWPQIRAQDTTGYEAPLSLMDTSLDEDLQKHYRQTIEFYAGHAFLLGLRTGAGLGETIAPPSTRG